MSRRGPPSASTSRSRTARAHRPKASSLDACRSRNRGDQDAAQLAETTVRLGFANVIDAFHVSRGGQPTQTRFFVDERASRQGITLTHHGGPITGVRDALSGYQDGRCAELLISRSCRRRR